MKTASLFWNININRSVNSLPTFLAIDAQSMWSKKFHFLPFFVISHIKSIITYATVSNMHKRIAARRTIAGRVWACSSLGLGQQRSLLFLISLPTISVNKFFISFQQLLKLYFLLAHFGECWQKYWQIYDESACPCQVSILLLLFHDVWR